MVVATVEMVEAVETSSLFQLDHTQSQSPKVAIVSFTIKVYSY